jgi:hypothetical protein
MIATILLSFLATVLAFAQQPPPAPATAPHVDAGQYAHDTYSNECLGFSFHMPQGWLAKSQGISGLARAIHQAGGGLGLLMIEQPKQGTFGNTITLYASPVSDQNADVKEFVSHAVQAQTKRAPDKNKVLRDTSAVEYGGQKFFRSDYKVSFSYGRDAYRSLVFTRFRKYLIGEMVNAGSQEELNQAVDSLKGISFREDIPNPTCEK